MSPFFLRKNKDTFLELKFCSSVYYFLNVFGCPRVTVFEVICFCMSLTKEISCH